MAGPRQSRVRRSVQAALDGTAAMAAAAGEGHHLALGPGPELEAEWVAAGLTLPDLPAMRRYRLDRITAQLDRQGYDAALLMDPMNIRYATDTTNMQVWVMHNGARYALVTADGHVIMWDYAGCEFLSGHNDLIDEVRPAIGSTYFLAGPRQAEQARRFAAEIVDVVAGHCGSRPGRGRGPRARLAVDQCSLDGYRALEEAGIELGSGQEVMELARAIKGPDEIAAMRCAVAACEAAMGDMYERLQPGMTERQVWAVLHHGNIARAGEWIETQILASGPRTNPWFQEASARVIEPGDLVAYDTDLVGAYGMMTDISRTWVVGRRPTAAQRDLHAMAREVIEHNGELLTPGRTLRELTFDSLLPDPERWRHYSCQYHGVGQCDEYPEVYFPAVWDEWGFDGVLEPGMVLTAESYVADRRGGEGVKLENQYLVTEAGSELLSHSPLDLIW